MSIPVPKIWQLWPTPGSDFIKTNHQNHIKTLRKLHNICMKLGTLCGVLSFYITSVFSLLVKGKTFVYLSPCLQKFDNSRTSSIYFSGIDKNYYVIPGRKCMVRGNRLTLRKQSTCDVLRLHRWWTNSHTHTHTHTNELENYYIDYYYHALGTLHIQIQIQIILLHYNVLHSQTEFDASYGNPQ